MAAIGTRRVVEHNDDGSVREYWETSCSLPRNPRRAAAPSKGQQHCYVATYRYGANRYGTVGEDDLDKTPRHILRQLKFLSAVCVSTERLAGYTDEHGVPKEAEYAWRDWWRVPLSGRTLLDVQEQCARNGIVDGPYWNFGVELPPAGFGEGPSSKAGSILRAKDRACSDHNKRRDAMVAVFGLEYTCKPGCHGPENVWPQIRHPDAGIDRRMSNYSKDKQWQYFLEALESHIGQTADKCRERKDRAGVRKCYAQLMTLQKHVAHDRYSRALKWHVLSAPEQRSHRTGCPLFDRELSVRKVLGTVHALTPKNAILLARAFFGAGTTVKPA